jgi:flagellar hook-associated protein 3 FlgL
MRIPSSDYTRSVLTQLNSMNKQQRVYQQQLTTGKKIEKSSEDTQLAARTMESEATIRKLSQYQDNASQASAIGDLSLTNIEHIRDLGDEVRGFVVNAQDTDAAVLGGKIDQMISDIIGLANTKNGSDYLHGGSRTDQAPFQTTTDASGSITAVTYTGGSAGRSIQVADGITISPFTDSDANTTMETHLNALLALRDGLLSGDSSAVSTAMASLEDSDDDLAAVSGDLAVTQLRIEQYNTINEQKQLTLEEQTTADTQVDQAAVIAGLLNLQQAYQGSLQATTKILGLDILNFI